MLLRRVLMVASVALGAIVVAASAWLAIFTIAEPGCAVDLDDSGAVLVLRVLSAAWLVSAIVGAVLAVARFRRAQPGGWQRVGVASSVPLGGAVLWLVWAGLAASLLSVLGAGPGSSACV